MFLVATELDGQTTLRLVVGSPQTQPRHVAAAWDTVRREAAALLHGDGSGGGGGAPSAATAAPAAAGGEARRGV
jgi:hypothetical protein